MNGKRLLAWWAALLALVCGYSMLQRPAPACGGIMRITPPPHPQFRLQSAQVSPTSGIVPGQKLTITAVMIGPGQNCVMEFCASNLSNEQDAAYWSAVLVYDPGSFVPLYDDGQHGDMQAHDGIWCGEATAPETVNAKCHTGVRLRFTPDSSAVEYAEQYLMTADLQYADNAEAADAAGSAPAVAPEEACGA